MADEQKVLVNLATGMEDAERVTVAFLVSTAALDKGKQAAIWLTKDAVRLALPEEAKGEACDGCPPLERLFGHDLVEPADRGPRVPLDDRGCLERMFHDVLL